MYVYFRFLADAAFREKGQKWKSPLKEEAVPSMFSYGPVEKKVRQASMDRATRRTKREVSLSYEKDSQASSKEKKNYPSPNKVKRRQTIS